MIFEALGQLWTGPGYGVTGDLRALSQQEMQQMAMQNAWMYENVKPNPAYEMLLAQYKEAMWVPPGWQYWFEIGDELR